MKARSFGCLLLILGICLAILWAISDPLRALWLFADTNGALTKWEEKSGIITKISRSCGSTSASENDLTASDCKSDFMLEAFLAKRIGNDAVRQACFENRNNKNAKNCLGKFKGPKNGKALFEITSLNENNEAIVSTLELDSQTHAFYLFTEGDRIQFESCKANPTVVRILPTLKWAPVKGC